MWLRGLSLGPVESYLRMMSSSEPRSAAIPGDAAHRRRRRARQAHHYPQGRLLHCAVDEGRGRGHKAVPFGDNRNIIPDISLRRAR